MRIFLILSLIFISTNSFAGRKYSCVKADGYNTRFEMSLEKGENQTVGYLVDTNTDDGNDVYSCYNSNPQVVKISGDINLTCGDRNPIASDIIIVNYDSKSKQGKIYNYDATSTHFTCSQ